VAQDQKRKKTSASHQFQPSKPDFAPLSSFDSLSASAQPGRTATPTAASLSDSSMVDVDHESKHTSVDPALSDVDSSLEMDVENFVTLSAASAEDVVKLSLSSAIDLSSLASGSSGGDTLSVGSVYEPGYMVHVVTLVRPFLH
jgi:hypothetical protein